MSFIKKDFSSASECILNEDLFIYPTDTAYALGTNALSDNALLKLLKYKGNRKNKNISVAFSDIDMIQDFAYVDDRALLLINKYLPGKLTLILKKRESKFSQYISNDNTIGVRIPNRLDLLNLIKSIQIPITVTSANISDNPTPFSIKEYLTTTPKDKVNLISLIIDSGKIESEVSTIIDISSKKINVLREGDIKKEEILSNFD
jgi:L-threonylcarbamoyladenylate synthase